MYDCRSSKGNSCYSTTPWGPTRPGCRVLGLALVGAAADVELDRAEGSLVPLDRHAQGRQQALGRVEVHDDPLVGLHVLAAGGERLGIQAEVEDDLLGSRGHSAEVGVRRKGARIVDDDLGRLLLRGLEPVCARSLFRSSRGPDSRSKSGAAGRAGSDHEGRGNGALSFPICARSGHERNSKRRPGSSRLLSERGFDQAVELGQGASRGSVLGQHERPAGRAPGRGGLGIVKVLPEPQVSSSASATRRAALRASSCSTVSRKLAV